MFSRTPGKVLVGGDIGVGGGYKKLDAKMLEALLLQGEGLLLSTDGGGKGCRCRAGGAFTLLSVLLGHWVAEDRRGDEGHL